MYQILKNIDLDAMTPEQVKFDLTSAFHDSSNPKIMYADIVVSGKFGLHGYYDELVVYILDLMSLSEPRHEEFYQLFSNTSRSLARKVVNHFKVRLLIDSISLCLISYQDGRHKSTSTSKDSTTNSKVTLVLLISYLLLIV